MLALIEQALYLLKFKILFLNKKKKKKKKKKKIKKKINI